MKRSRCHPSRRATSFRSFFRSSFARCRRRATTPGVKRGRKSILIRAAWPLVAEPCADFAVAVAAAANKPGHQSPLESKHIPAVPPASTLYLHGLMGITAERFVPRKGNGPRGTLPRKTWKICCGKIHFSGVTTAHV